MLFSFITTMYLWVYGFLMIFITIGLKFFHKQFCFFIFYFYICRVGHCHSYLLISMYHVSIGEYLLSLVLSEFSWTPALIQTKQQDQRCQFPKPNPGHGLRKWVCWWWEQHFWGQPESKRIPISSPKEWSTQQQYESVQLLATSPASAQWDQAQLCRLQWNCVSHGWECTPIITTSGPPSV